MTESCLAVVDAVAEALLQASTTFRPDQIRRYQEAIAAEEQPEARWVLEQILENASIASQQRRPLCDDTGIPHVFVEFGTDIRIGADTEAAVREGVSQGLSALPGRPMAVRGNDVQRLDQSAGLHPAPEDLEPAPLVFASHPGHGLRLTVLMLGGGPEIRSRTFRVFHRHDSGTVLAEVGQWARDVSGELGCTPCVPAVGIGRTHFEATRLMLQAMKEGRLDRQNDFERAITASVNAGGAGALGLGGRITALGSFVRIGPQRASGVRIVCLRPGCCFDPRRATVTVAAADL